jgi:hypothetical protein
MAGYVSVRVVDGAGKQLDSSVVQAFYYGSPLYNVVSELVSVGHIGELFTLVRKEGFKVRFEGGVWKIEHHSYPVKGLLYPQEDGGFLLEVVVPEIDVNAEQALSAAWRALRACNELREELGKLKERARALEDGLRGVREALRGFEELEHRLRKLEEEFCNPAKRADSLERRKREEEEGEEW